jgi:drug/metabolite transporter (DMT)-like permease
VVALLSKFWLHETITIYRWVGILLIVCGVGFVANGPSLTEHKPVLDEAAPADEGVVTGRAQ